MYILLIYIRADGIWSDPGIGNSTTEKVSNLVDWLTLNINVHTLGQGERSTIMARNLISDVSVRSWSFKNLGRGRGGYVDLKKLLHCNLFQKLLAFELSSKEISVFECFIVSIY